MAGDPICGMTVYEASPLHAARDGQTFYFCSKHCRKIFVGEAGSAIALAPVANGISATHAKHSHSQHDRGGVPTKPSVAAKYFCPMCPGAEADKPGDCPKCGMAL